jgi:hypothetical protein
MPHSPSLTLCQRSSIADGSLASIPTVEGNIDSVNRWLSLSVLGDAGKAFASKRKSFWSDKKLENAHIA